MKDELGFKLQFADPCRRPLRTIEVDFAHFAGTEIMGEALQLKRRAAPHRQMLAEYRLQGDDEVLPAKPPILLILIGVG
jgi:hypothetical protein